MDENMGKYIEEGIKDWTVATRNFAKLDHIIKIASQMIFFMTNVLKKQKI